jgi:anti-sigma B factor antagonist
MDLQLRVYEEEGATWVQVGGEVEMSNAPQLREALLCACLGERPRVVVELAAVPFIDSTGIGTLIVGLKRAREKGGAFALLCPQPRVRRVFEISGLLPALAVFDTRAAARDYVTGGDDAQ